MGIGGFIIATPPGRWLACRHGKATAYCEWLRSRLDRTHCPHETRTGRDRDASESTRVRWMACIAICSTREAKA